MPTLQLFHTCLVNEFAPHVGFAVVRVLERLGFRVEVPLAQTCCGQPAFNAGFHDDARIAARHTIEVLEQTTGTIVVPSGSCGDMLVHQYPALFATDEAWRTRATRIAERCQEFSVVVAGHLHDHPLRPVGATIAYHPSCHLSRGLGIDHEPRAVIEAVNGTPAVGFDASDECCGFGGLFALKHADISARMLQRKLDHVAAAAPLRLVSCDLGCLLHLGGGLHRRESPIRVQHLAELVDEALA